MENVNKQRRNFLSHPDLGIEMQEGSRIFDKVSN